MIVTHQHCLYSIFVCLISDEFGWDIHTKSVWVEILVIAFIVKLRSRSGPGPVQVQSESKLKRSLKISKDNKDLDQEQRVNIKFTVPPTFPPPDNFSNAPADRHGILGHLGVGFTSGGITIQLIYIETEQELKGSYILGSDLEVSIKILISKTMAKERFPQNAGL